MKKAKNVKVMKLDANKYLKEIYPNLYKSDIGLDDVGALKFYDRDKREQLEGIEARVEL